MKMMFPLILCASLLFGISEAVEKPGGKGEKVKASYSTGYRAVNDLKRQGIDIDPKVLLKGVEDAMGGREPLLTRQQMKDVLVDLQKQITEEQERQMKEEAAKNLAEGRAFLEANSKKEGVKELPDGLQYKVLREGTGLNPSAGDTVTVHYRGTLIDGTEFDSSFKRGKPATFRADRVIAGWKDALLKMKEGAKWQIFVPPALGYGERRNGRIGPNSTLVFEMELLSVHSLPEGSGSSLEGAAGKTR